MPSSTEISELFRDGKLGEMLVREFGGNIELTNPVKDSQFRIGFKSEEETPTADPILKKVTELYSGLGYEVEIKEECLGDNNFVVVIHYDKLKISWKMFIIVLDTRYSIKPGGDKTFLRVTSLSV